ncbi:rhodanese-like domain-containing protein [Candidatus Uhrbacteria bacterium]|nr:rhodanese-like domain-containing protein [Candidatus Uhrbacteria bacterium]
MVEIIYFMKAPELRKKLEQQEDVLLLDVREHDEYESSEDKIKGAHNVPMGKVFTEAAKGNLPKDKKIITVCKSGGRCEIVARELQAKGYDIEYLEGGMEEWKKNLQ